MKKDKETAYNDFLNMIFKSWTWARLTDDERANCRKALENSTRAAFGSYHQRYEIFNAVYYGFLEGLNYAPIGWRETDAGAPLF